jgi:hypothetical protein
MYPIANANQVKRCTNCEYYNYTYEVLSLEYKTHARIISHTVMKNISCYSDITHGVCVNCQYNTHNINYASAYAPSEGVFCYINNLA